MSYTKTDLEKKSENFMRMFLEARGATVVMHPDGKFDSFDMRVTYENGLTFFLEIKGRLGIWNDLLIEIIEDIKTCDPGWWYQTHANKIIYMFYKEENQEEPDFIYELFKPDAEKYILENAKQLFRQSNISTKGYGTTLSIFLPISLAKKIYPEEVTP